VRVAPLRETPGTSASAWAKPLALAGALGREEDQAEHDQGRADQVEVARLVLDLVGEGEAEDPDRDRAEQDVPAEPGVGRAAHLGVAQAAGPGDRDAPQVVAEVEEDGREGAELGHGREGRAGIVPAEERRDDPEVAGAGDRQELGEALHDAEDDGFELAHSRCERLRA
jgi:hypothetical protein